MTCSPRTAGLARVRGLRARRALLLRARARLGDRGRQPHRLPLHGALRAERRRQVVAPARERRANAARAARGSRLVVVFSSWSEMPEPALARTIANAAGVEPGDARRRRDARPGRRDLYLSSTRPRSTSPTTARTTASSTALAALVDAPAPRQRPAFAPRGRAGDTRSAQGRDPESVRQRPAARPPGSRRRPRGDRRAARALERAGRRGPVIEDELVDGRARRRGCRPHRARPRRPGNRRQERPRTGIEAPYLQLVMQRLWEVERSAARWRCERRRLRSSVARARSWRIISIEPSRRSHPRSGTSPRGSSTTSSPRRGRRSLTRPATSRSSPAAPKRRAKGPRASRRPSHPAHGRSRSLGDLPRRARRRRARLDEPVRGGARRSRARDDARRRNRRLGFLTAGALVGLAFAAVLTTWAVVERDRAGQRAVEAHGHELEARALTLIPTDTSLAVALAAEAARIAPGDTAEDVLREALQVDRLLQVIPPDGSVSRRSVRARGADSGRRLGREGAPLRARVDPPRSARALCSRPRTTPRSSPLPPTDAEWVERKPRRDSPIHRRLRSGVRADDAPLTPPSRRARHCSRARDSMWRRDAMYRERGRPHGRRLGRIDGS